MAQGPQQQKLQQSDCDSQGGIFGCRACKGSQAQQAGLAKEWPSALAGSTATSYNIPTPTCWTSWGSLYRRQAEALRQTSCQVQDNLASWFLMQNWCTAGIEDEVEVSQSLDDYHDLMYTWRAFKRWQHHLQICSVVFQSSMETCLVSKRRLRWASKNLHMSCMHIRQ